MRTTDQPTLTDSIVTLDAFRPDDAAAHLAGEDEEHARRFGWHPRRSSIRTVRTAIRDWNASWREGGPLVGFAVRRASDGLLVGGCELRRLDAASANVSYWTFPTHRGRGYSTRAVRLVTAWGFDDLGIDRIQLSAAEDNLASLHVAYAVGFALCGVRTDDRGERELVHELVRHRVP